MLKFEREGGEKGRGTSFNILERESLLLSPLSRVEERKKPPGSWLPVTYVFTRSKK